MDWVEIIALRSFRRPETDKAIAAFHGIAAVTQEVGLKGIHLLQNLAIENNLSIFIFWQGAAPATGKSQLGVRLAAAFAEFGQIHHCGWRYQGSLKQQSDTASTHMDSRLVTSDR